MTHWLDEGRVPCHSGPRAGRHLPPPGPDTINPSLSSSPGHPGARIGSPLRKWHLSEEGLVCCTVPGPALPRLAFHTAQETTPCGLFSSHGRLSNVLSAILFFVFFFTSPILPATVSGVGRELHDVWSG